MTIRAGVVFLSLSTLWGCAHFHSDKNAPGIVDLEQPPVRDPADGLEPPQDPGESLLALNSGVFSAGGVTLGGGVTGTGAFSTGLEVTLNRGVNPRSHYEDDFVIYPEQGVGANIGLELINRDGFGPGPVYFEGQWFRHFVGAAAGWSINPADGANGPQVTLFGLNLFMRVNHTFGEETVVLFGLMGKSSLVWTESL